MLVIHGRNVIGFLDDVPIFCGTDLIFSEEKEVIPASTITSNGWKEFRLRKRSWSVQVSGLTELETGDQVSYFDLISSANARNVKNISVMFTDEDGNTQEVSGLSYLSQSSISNPVNKFSNASVTFVGNGSHSLAGGSS